MVFCYQNRSDLIWKKKNVLVIEKNSKAEGQEFEIFLRSLEQFIQTVKGQNNFGNIKLLQLVPGIRTIRIQIGKKYWDWETCRKS